MDETDRIGLERVLRSRLEKTKSSRLEKMQWKEVAASWSNEANSIDGDGQGSLKLCDDASSGDGDGGAEERR